MKQEKDQLNNKKKKILIGYIFIAIGILLPLISLISMSWAQISGHQAYKRYAESKTLEDARLTEQMERYNQRVTQDGVQFVDPFRNREYERFYGFGNDESVFAYISIPKLRIYLPIRLGAGESHLAIGAAHVDGTHLPIGGASTRSVIAGHRAAVRELFFYNIDKLEPGDLIEILRGSKRLIYEVTDQEKINYTAWDKLSPIPGEDRLTLLTCMPFGREPDQRLIVNAKRRMTNEDLGTPSNFVKDPSESLMEEIAVDQRLLWQERLIYGSTLLGILLFSRTLLQLLKVSMKMRKNPVNEAF